MTALAPTPNTDLVPFAGRWALDAGSASVTFHTKAMWLLPVKGNAKVSSGDAEVTPDGTVHGHLVIDATSITTGIKKRDAHLQTADFFDTATHPTIDFELTGVRTLATDRMALDGQLTIHGTSRPVTFDAEVATTPDRVTVTGVIEDLDRSDWGVDFSKMGAGLHNRVDLRATFTRG